MMKASVYSVARASVRARAGVCGASVAPRASARLYSKLSEEPQQVETKISDTSDPNRNPFFQYSWGSWLKNDKIEKAKRQTKFSIEGTTKLVQNLVEEIQNGSNDSDVAVKAPKTLADGSNILSHNLSVIGKTFTDKLMIKSIASIHEGKHHRVYKVTLSNDKELILRIPYKLESEFGISQKIKSEVATTDFLQLKLGLNVPKVLSYGVNKSNHLETPYILMEYIPGDLLMKQWEPLITDEMPNANEKLLDVVRPISEFQDKVNSVVFNKFGSLYFTDDVDGVLQNDVPYEGEENPVLKQRWRIGPTVEKPFSKNKNKLDPSQINNFNGPYSEPHELITNIANIELENLRVRLSRAKTDGSSAVENVNLLEKQITTFEHLKTMAPLLINQKSKNIPNVEELFKPRLYLPDLDPLNVILNSTRNNDLYFMDFEYSTIKPFVLFTYPSFIAYSGVKIYNLEEDVPNYNELDELDKQQYQFMYYKTRNERLWELELNRTRHDLIAIASPHIKILKSPYVQALEYKADHDYLYIEGSIIQLKGIWEAYVSNEICNSSDTEFPIDYSEEYIQQFEAELQAYQAEISSTPFAATGGWIPQDMFNQLKDQGIIVETLDGYKIETEKILQDAPEPEK